MDISKKKFITIISGLILIHILMVLLVMHGVPEMGFVNGVPNYISGDEQGYFNVAKNLSRFEFKDQPGFGTIGAAIVYVPFVWLTGAEKMQDIWQITFIFQAFIFYGVSIILVSYIAKYIFKNNLLGIVTGFIYVVYPYFLYFLNLGPNRGDFYFFMDGMWLKLVMSDVPSAFFVYLGVFLFFWSIEQKNQVGASVWTGLVGGFASLIRITNILFCLVIGIGYLFKKKYKEFLLFVFFAFSVFSMQLIFNYHNYGGFLKFGQLQDSIYKEAVKERLSAMKVSHMDRPSYYDPHNYLYLLSVIRRYVPLYWFFVPLLFILFVLSLIHLLKKNATGGLFLGSIIILYFFYYGAFSPAARNLRYWLPILPFVLIELVSAFLMVKKIIYEKIIDNSSGL